MNHVKVAVWGWVAVGLLLTGCATDEPSAGRWHSPGLANRTVNDSVDSASTTAKLPDLKASAELPDLLAYAALNNPGLEAAFNRWKAALERVPQAKSLPDPRFTYRYFIEEVETRMGASGRQVGCVRRIVPNAESVAICDKRE